MSNNSSSNKNSSSSNSNNGTVMIGDVFADDMLTARIAGDIGDQEKLVRGVSAKYQQLKMVTERMEGLLELTMEIQESVEEAQAWLDAAESDAVKANWDVERGNLMLSDATDHADAARGKKWIVFVVIFVVLVVVGLIAGTELKKTAYHPN